MPADVAGAFAELIRDPRDLGLVYVALKNAIALSFRQDAARGEILVMTDAEHKRRTAICLYWFQIMRKECGYSLDRALDFLPRALRAQLDGVLFEPPKGDGGWAPSVLRRDIAAGG